MHRIAICLFGLWLSTSVAKAAKNVVVVIDDSGSMVDKMRSGTRRIKAAKQALNTVLNKLPDDSKVGILALNRGWIMPLEKLDRSKSATRINRLRAQGGTLLGENMKIGADELMKLRQDQVYGEYSLLVVTDGEANDAQVLSYVLPDIMSRGFTVDVIGVDMESEHSLATLVHNYRSADDPESLQTAIAESLAESDDSVAVGGESDFEVLEGFPVDLAMSVIGNLTSFKNSPVAGDDYDPSNFEFSGMNLPTIQRQGGAGRPIMFGAIFLMGVIMFGVATLSSLLRAARRV